MRFIRFRNKRAYENRFGEISFASGEFIIDGDYVVGSTDPPITINLKSKITKILYWGKKYFVYWGYKI